MQIDNVVNNIIKDTTQEYDSSAKSSSKTAQFQDALNKMVKDKSQSDSTNQKYESSIKNDTQGSTAVKDNTQESTAVKDNAKSKDSIKDKDNAEDTEDEKKLDDLLTELFQILNLNGGTQNLDQNLKNSINDKLSELNKVCKDLNIDIGAAVKMLKNSIISSNADILKNAASILKSDMTSTSYAEVLKSALNNDSAASNFMNIKDNDESMMNKIKSEINSLISSINKETTAKSDGKSGTMNDSQKESTGESETNSSSILEKLTGDKDSKIDKMTNFMSMLKNSDTVSENTLSQNVVVNKATLPSDIIKTMKYMENNNLKDLTVKIEPKELGELYIKVTMENGALKASVSASNKDAYNILNANLLDIQNKLNDAGIKIQNFALNIYEDTTYFSNDSNKGNHDNESSSKNKKGTGVLNEIDAADDDKKYAEIYNNINLFA